jgi:PBP1b-binding outer membrane lipoprotein LpoB
MKHQPLLLAGVAVMALFLGGCSMAQDKSVAEGAVNDFHQRLDKGDFEGIYSAAHPDFKAASTKKDFVALLAAVHRKLGNFQSDEETNWNINSSNFTTTVVLVYKTKFDNGDGVETFTYRIQGDQALLYSYNINSPTLIIN